MNRILRQSVLALASAGCVLPVPAVAQSRESAPAAGQQGTPVECLASSLSSAMAGSDADLPSCEALYLSRAYQDYVDPWRIGFGAGYGQRTNPLINSDDIPVYGILQFSYFGEHFFFDNGDIGWFMASGRDWSANLIAGVGGERSFFSYLNDSSVGFAPGDFSGPALEESPPENGGPDETQEYKEPEAPDRDFVIDGGLELLYNWRQTEVQLQLLTDISDKHNGQEAWLSWGLPGQWGNLAFSPSIGVTWMSEDAADYYYGVRGSEAQPGLPAYDVGAAFNYFARVSLSYRLSEHWQVVSVLQYEKLAGEISDSPSVEEDHVTTSFLGLYYEF
jgi:outer membrane protein